MTKEAEDPLHSLGQPQTSLWKAQKRTHRLPGPHKAESASRIPDQVASPALVRLLGEQRETAMDAFVYILQMVIVRHSLKKI